MHCAWVLSIFTNLRIKTICGLFVLAYGAWAQESTVAMHEVPLLTCSGLPCVELTSTSVNVVRLVIDLASVNAYLDIKTAQARGLKLSPLKGANGAEISDVQQTTIPGAKLGELALGDFPFMVLDMSADPHQPGKKKDAWFPADGALAFGSFQNRRLQLDWNKHLLLISEPLPSAVDCPRDCSDLVAKPFSKYGAQTLTAQGFEVEGRAVSAQIDTLFTGTMLVYPDGVDKAELSGIKTAKHKEEFPFSQGGLRLTQGIGLTFTFHKDALLTDAPVYFWNSKEEAAPKVSFDATVGTGLLSKALFTFDFKSNKMWMEPPSGN